MISFLMPKGHPFGLEQDYPWNKIYLLWLVEGNSSLHHWRDPRRTPALCWTCQGWEKWNSEKAEREFVAVTDSMSGFYTKARFWPNHSWKSKNLVPTKNFAGSRRSLGKVLTLEEAKVALGLSWHWGLLSLCQDILVLDILNALQGVSEALDIAYEWISAYLYPRLVNEQTWWKCVQT